MYNDDMSEEELAAQLQAEEEDVEWNAPPPKQEL